MSLNRIVTEALDGNPLGLKEAVSKILAEKIELALEAKMNESTDALDKHISTFSKKLGTSSAKPTRYISDGKAIPGMKHVEVSKEHNHQDVFDALKSMGYSKTRGFDPSPKNFTARHNSETMTMTSDPVHHKDGISAHFEQEHGSKMKVHFKLHTVKEDLDEANEIKGDHLTSAKLVHADLKKIDSLSPESKKILKRHENMLISKYGVDWRTKAGINEDLDENESVNLDEDYDQYKLKQIHKDYKGYKALSTADLLKHHKGMRKISGNYTANDAGGKQGMIASILRDKHSDKHLNSYFDLKPSQRRALDEDFDQIDEITQTERRNLAFFEKQAVRAAEKANVGALSRAEKEAWIDDYIAKNHIPKGAAGSAVYSGVIKVRPIKESLDESAPFKSEGEYVVKGKSPFWKQDHYINTHEDPRATLIKRHIKHATRMSFEDATIHAKNWEKSYNPNNYKTEVVKINEEKSVTESTLEDKIVAAMIAKRKKQAEAEQQGKKKVSWADISKSFDKKTEK